MRRVKTTRADIFFLVSVVWFLFLAAALIYLGFAR
jgi:hypothetical protein